mgnify:FL=1
MKQVWKIDPEFRRLSVPLSPEEENRLENSLLREGCKEPIVVWHGCILDGHKRYEICNYEEMEYETVEMNFATKDDALLWVCKNHLATVNPNSTVFRYLLGKRYVLEREMYKKNPEKIHINYVKKVARVGAVCGTLAEETSMNPGTVRKYGTLALQLDQIAEKDMALFDAILAEKISITYGKVMKYSEMETTKMISMRRRLLHDDIKMRRRKPRKKAVKSESKEEKKEQTAPLEMGIKEMPVFDPDMEFRGLALTIPTWMNAIARTRAKTDIELVSEPTKAQLAMILRRLEEQITQTLEVIEK